MRIRYALVTGALALGLAACGNDKPAGQSEQADGREVAQYQPGQTYDAEDYNGPAQQVTNWESEGDVWSTRDKYKSERYCKTKKANGTCKTWGTRQVKSGTERYVSDDADWYLILADGTRVDVDAETQARYPAGTVYP